MASNLRVDTILPSTGTTLGIGTASGTINFLGNSNITTTGTINAASATITGNLGVGGVLTYEDVTNIDSVGVITARSGINVSGGEVKVGTAVTVSSGGVITSGIVTATNVSVASSVTAATFHGSGANLTDISSVGGNTGVDFNDDVKARFGSSNQLEIFYGSSLGNVKVTSGNLNLISSGGVVTKVNTSEDAIVCNANSSVDLYHNGSKKFETTSSGINVTGSVTASAPVAWYGEQDTAHNVSHQSWTTVINLGTNPVNTTGWNESTGIFTVPSGQAGAYMLTGGAGIDDLNSTDWVQVGFSVNDGVPTVWSRKRAYTPVSGQVYDNNLSNIKNLNVGDTVKLQIYHSEGTVEPTEENRCWFGGHRIN